MASVLFLGCIQAPGGASPTEKPISEIVKEDVPTPTIKASVTPLASANATPGQKVTASPTAAATPAGTVSTTVVAQVREFAVELDDDGFYPDAITVQKGVPVRLTLKLRERNVYFGGADVKSSVFNELGMKPGESRTVAFTPETSFEAQDIWPASNVLKGTLKINVE
ncbi:hypothetical protein HYV43_03405 [Candidatus Micrarchaeota archaeon]|nr:hypothetical protein [Candidatus Micrarchaeota archaeon]